jgi:hypothetical protein
VKSITQGWKEGRSGFQNRKHATINNPRCKLPSLPLSCRELFIILAINFNPFIKPTQYL